MVTERNLWQKHAKKQQGLQQIASSGLLELHSLKLQRDEMKETFEYLKILPFVIKEEKEHFNVKGLRPILVQWFSVHKELEEGWRQDFKLETIY